MKLKKILVPVDFSENSLNALRYAAAFAKSSGAGLFVLHASDNEELDNEIKGNLAPDHLMELLRKEPWMDSIKISTVIHEGKVPDVILEESKKLDIDLVVMGTQGAGSMARSLIGTNTTRVVGKSECAVLAIPAEATYSPIRKAIVAVDLEQRTDKLIYDIIMMLKAVGAVVLLVYVGKDHDGQHSRELQSFAEEMKRACDYDKIVGKLIESTEFPMVLESFALDIEADLISMITHHRGIFESIFDPSESKLYSYHTTIPLLVVPHHRRPVFFL